MKLRRGSILIIALLAALLLVGCGAVPEATVTTGDTEPTVADIFTQPQTEPQASDPEPAPTEAIDLGMLAIGPAGDPLMDDRGAYRLYEGGEMHLPYRVTATGQMAQRTIGLLLFLDGRPQPYKVGKDGTYKYMHSFQPEGEGDTVLDLYFVPVTGQKGDLLEFYSMPLLDPDYQLADGMKGFVLTGGSIASGTRLQFNAAPPDAPQVPGLDRLSDLSLSFTDAEEMSEWSENQLLTQISRSFSVNGIPEGRSSKVFDYKGTEQFPLQYQLYGTSFVNFGLVIFVDNEPLLFDGEPWLPLEIRNGQKTVMEATLNMAGYDGESPIYSVLVPRNYYSSQVKTQAFLEPGSSLFLLKYGDS